MPSMPEGDDELGMEMRDGGMEMRDGEMGVMEVDGARGRTRGVRRGGAALGGVGVNNGNGNGGGNVSLKEETRDEDVGFMSAGGGLQT